MDYGNKPTDGSNLILEDHEFDEFVARYPAARLLLRRYVGSKDYINGTRRFCFWIHDDFLPLAVENEDIVGSVWLG